MTAPINWQQFGLKSNPYDTLPLVEGGELALEEAFVGREKEREFLDGLFDSEDRVCLTVCGDVGVGKTSLANVQKYEWKYRKPKLLFSFRREIEACDDVLSKRGFITEILASVVREIKLLEPSLLKEEVLMKVVSILDVSQNISISGGISASYMGNGASVEFARAHSASQPLQISTAVLEEYLRELLDFVRTTPIRGFSYSGLVVHMNNFDVVLAERDGLERTIRFFNEVRDILQTRHLYFLFLGPRNLFKEVISAEQRVKSIFFQTPLTVAPLSKQEVVSAFEQRMRLLQSENVMSYIKPIEDEVIFRLYDLYNGDIRSIMSAIRDIIGQYGDKLVTPPLSLDQAMLLLGHERVAQIERATTLSESQMEVLRFFVQNGKELSQAEASRLFGKSPSNISSYYFKPLKEAGIIEEKRREGKSVFWGLTTHYEPLKWVYGSRVEVHKEIEKSAKAQPSLFEEMRT